MLSLKRRDEITYVTVELQICVVVVVVVVFLRLFMLLRTVSIHSCSFRDVFYWNNTKPSGLPVRGADPTAWGRFAGVAMTRAAAMPAR
jgi:hypothetical protein